MRILKTDTGIELTLEEYMFDSLSISTLTLAIWVFANQSQAAHSSAQCPSLSFEISLQHIFLYT